MMKWFFPYNYSVRMIPVTGSFHKTLNHCLVILFKGYKVGLPITVLVQRIWRFVVQNLMSSSKSLKISYLDLLISKHHDLFDNKLLKGCLSH